MLQKWSIKDPFNYEMTGKSGLLLSVIGPRFNQVIETRVEKLENLNENSFIYVLEGQNEKTLENVIQSLSSWN